MILLIIISFLIISDELNKIQITCSKETISNKLKVTLEIKNSNNESIYIPISYNQVLNDYSQVRLNTLQPTKLICSDARLYNAVIVYPENRDVDFYDHNNRAEVHHQNHTYFPNLIEVRKNESAKIKYYIPFKNKMIKDCQIRGHINFFTRNQFLRFSKYIPDIKTHLVNNHQEIIFETLDYLPINYHEKVNEKLSYDNYSMESYLSIKKIYWGVNALYFDCQ